MQKSLPLRLPPSSHHPPMRITKYYQTAIDSFALQKHNQHVIAEGIRQMSLFTAKLTVATTCQFRDSILGCWN